MSIEDDFKEWNKYLQGLGERIYGVNATFPLSDSIIIDKNGTTVELVEGKDYEIIKDQENEKEERTAIKRIWNSGEPG